MSAIPATPPRPNKVLLHVGLPKSGTTAIQHAAAARRDRLLDHGVLYPGAKHNHGRAALAVLGRTRGWEGGAPASTRAWSTLAHQVRTYEGRQVLVSHESLAAGDPDTCRRVVEDLGGDVHVVLTMRNQPSVLGSKWQQYLKRGMTETFDQWLREAVGDGSDEGAGALLRSARLADPVARWAQVVGAENVTVLVLDPRRPELLSRTFEHMLDLPEGLLADQRLDGSQLNRSLSFAAAELVRSVNVTLRSTEGFSWADYTRFCRRGAIARVLGRVELDSAGRKIVPPRWAAEQMERRAREQAARIAASGVHVVGDLDELSRPVAAPDDVEPPDAVPIAVAREFALGAISAGLGRGAGLEPSSADDEAAPRGETWAGCDVLGADSVVDQARAVAGATTPVPTRALALAVLVRARRSLRRRTRRAAGPVRRLLRPRRHP